MAQTEDMSDGTVTLEELLATLDLLEEGGIPPSILEEIRELIRIGHAVKYSPVIPLRRLPKPEEYIRWRS
jgi:hypothetical protein